MEAISEKNGGGGGDEDWKSYGGCSFLGNIKDPSEKETVEHIYSHFGYENPLSASFVHVNVTGGGAMPYGQFWFTVTKVEVVLDDLPPGCDEYNTRLVVDVENVVGSWSMSGKPLNTMLEVSLKRTPDGKYKSEFREKLEDEILHALTQPSFRIALGLQTCEKGEDGKSKLTNRMIVHKHPYQIRLRIYVPKNNGQNLLQDLRLGPAC